MTIEEKNEFIRKICIKTKECTMCPLCELSENACYGDGCTDEQIEAHYDIITKGKHDKMEFKVGDKVKVRENLEVGKKYGGFRFVSDMKQNKGKTAIIKIVSPTRILKYSLDIDGENWYTNEMLERVEEQTKAPKILDSGERTQFETGAVRDIQASKGRCDLLPLDVLAELFGDGILFKLKLFKQTGKTYHLYNVLYDFAYEHYQENKETMILEVSKHFEEGATKYGENNWQKGIPANCYINSAVRHYLKFKRGDEDEPHDRAFVWNVMCCIWTCINKPELNNYIKQENGDI